MGNLATYLAAAFCEHCPRGFTSTTETALAPALTTTLGYAPRADVCLKRSDGSLRVWIEFEISRADPVANHAKFAIAHGFAPQRPGDVFVSMMTSHVGAGRRNLGSAAILLMRQLGMSAFQTLLLPDLTPPTIKELNHSSAEVLRSANLPIQRELERAMKVLVPQAERPRYRIHFASDPGEVLLNARRWNAEMHDPAARQLWGKRRIQYFVHDPLSGDFAPSKFCAFVPILAGDRVATSRLSIGYATAHLMSVDLYADLDESEPRFDGHRARTHLERQLLMQREPLASAHPLRPRFDAWLDRNAEHIAVRGQPEVLALPTGFR